MLATHAQYACMYRSRVPICSEGISTLDHMNFRNFKKYGAKSASCLA